MPKPIVCLSEALRQYLEGFRPCFSKRQWKYFVTVLLGLVECEERKTMSGHCLFTGLYVLLGQRCPLPMQMYRQKAVYQQEGVVFESKIEMDTHQIENFYLPSMMEN